MVHPTLRFQPLHANRTMDQWVAAVAAHISHNAEVASELAIPQTYSVSSSAIQCGLSDREQYSSASVWIAQYGSSRHTTPPCKRLFLGAQAPYQDYSDQCRRSQNHSETGITTANLMRDFLHSEQLKMHIGVSASTVVVA